MPVSPVALPPNHEYIETPATAQSPKLAFEALVTEAFRVREAARRQTAKVMVVLDELASEARKSA